jgi:hypothetical protein
VIRFMAADYLVAAKKMAREVIGGGLGTFQPT